MDFFKKFKKPTKDQPTKAAIAGTVVGVSAAVLNNGINQPATAQEALQKDTVNPIPPKEYVEKNPALTLTEQAKKASIEIDPKTVPENGYNAADYMLTKSGEKQPIEEKDRVRTPENAVDPDKLIKEATAYRKAYDTTTENGGTFVSPTEKKVSPEQIKADLKAYHETLDGKEIPNEPLPDDVNKDSSPEKTPDSQSSEGLNSEVTTFEIPSDPEEAKKFADKVIPTLFELLKKFPGALTGKNALLLTTIATSGLQAANNADAANLSAVYNNLNPDSTYVKSLSSEEALRYKASQIYLDYLKWQEKNMFKQDLSSLTLKKYAEELDLDEAAYQAVVEAEKRFKKNTERASLYRIKHSSSPISSNSILKKN